MPKAPLVLIREHELAEKRLAAALQTIKHALAWVEGRRFGPHMPNTEAGLLAIKRALRLRIKENTKGARGRDLANTDMDGGAYHMLTLAEAATMLGVTPNNLLQRIKKGNPHPPYIREGNGEARSHYRFVRSAVVDWLESLQVRAPKRPKRQRQEKNSIQIMPPTAIVEHEEIDPEGEE